MSKNRRIRLAEGLVLVIVSPRPGNPKGLNTEEGQRELLQMFKRAE